VATVATRDVVPQHAPVAGEHPPPARPRVGLIVYFIVGICFGIILVKSQVISWFRIQEMFRFQGFHMFGIFATAVPTALLTVQLMKRLGARTVTGERVTLAPKVFGHGVRYVVGGVIFGLGWALTGACPGPLFALLGSGVLVIALVIVSALAGTWTYACLRPRLPH
jgi:uncharacterized membrane protein YedE/YeeE